MRYAIISDIHSDYNSLQNVLSNIEKQEIDKIICLGDIVGYGNQPEEVVKEIMQRNIVCVCGNHEKALFDSKAYEFMTKKAKVAIDENYDALSDNSIKFLENLPNNYIESGIRFVHGMPPDSLFDYVHVSTNEEILKRLKLYKEQIAFCGHSHRTEIIAIKNKTISRNKSISFFEEYKLESNVRYIINTGSISLPRNEIVENSSYLIFDNLEGKISFIKI